jgi:hypothetical protein
MALPAEAKVNILAQGNPGGCAIPGAEPPEARPLIGKPAKLPFFFANHADDFDRHVERRIPGYGNLMESCAELSRHFVEDGTMVCNIGCSTGRMLGADADPTIAELCAGMAPCLMNGPITEKHATLGATFRGQQDS